MNENISLVTSRKPADVAAVSPSLICMDLCNLEQGVKELERAGCEMLHVDILDGYFSPSMPIGVDTVKQLKEKTSLAYDVHIMAMQNDFFVDEMVGIGAERICFHVETERHICKKLSQIRTAGLKAGVALTPATPIGTIEYALELCDFVLLMRINPGYASMPGADQYDFVTRKMYDLSETIARRGLDTTITVDGRVYFENVEEQVCAGLDTVVAGTSSIFSRDGDVKTNFDRLQKLIGQGLKARG